MNRGLIYTITGVVPVAVLVIGVLWFFFFRSSTSTPPTTTTTDNSFTVPNDTTSNTGTSNEPPPSTNGTQVINTSGQTQQTKIFQITPGPVAGATLIQVLHPTTTLARYINQEDGHVFDLPLDVPGAVPRVISNVTIPGGARVIWVEGGNAAIMQYFDDTIVKSVYLGFPAATTTNTAVILPTRIQFLPDAIVDIAASPDGKSVAYLLKTTSGVNGYIAKSDGTNSKKVFSLPLSQVLISWPSPGTLLAQTKSTAGVPGIVFSVDTTSGAATSLVYALGVTATADKTFSNIIYQATQSGTNVPSTYVHDVKKSSDRALSFDPYPEKCMWSALATSTAYCATPLSYVSPGYLDLWHLGVAGVADSLFSFNIGTDRSSIVATPGGTDGGIASNIFEMALSPNEKYLSFTTKSDRSVWGVRLTQ